MSNYLETAIEALTAIRQEKNADSPVGSDPYAERMQEAFRLICRTDYPQGMIVWLAEAYPRFYCELTERLPNDLNRLWREHQPIERFERVLQTWVETHQNTCTLYRTRTPQQSPIHQQNAGTDGINRLQETYQKQREANQ